ncbi:hypothetical protein ACSNN9_24715 [Micromonospora sp. URMC 107]|uniref:hypothetical protein n=1 Tax=Micromonospora sp. URMC 107 TaxID=3423418 RepID=UPI003F19CA6C
MHPFRRFLLAGIHQVATDSWANDERIVIQATFFDLVPDLPAPLTDPAALRRGMAAPRTTSGPTRTGPTARAACRRTSPTTRRTTRGSRSTR